MLRQCLEAKQLKQQREDLLQQFNKIRVRTEPQFVGRQQPRPEGSHEERYSDRQRTSKRDTNLWITTWQQLIDIADAKVMERKAQAAYASTGQNLARLHRAEQKAATLEHMYRGGKDPAEYSDWSKPSSGSSGSESAGSEPRRRGGGSLNLARRA